MDRFYGPCTGLHLTRKNYTISFPLASHARMPTNTMNLNSRGTARVSKPTPEGVRAFVAVLVAQLPAFAPGIQAQVLSRPLPGHRDACGGKVGGLDRGDCKTAASVYSGLGVLRAGRLCHAHFVRPCWSRFSGSASPKFLLEFGQFGAYWAFRAFRPRFA